MTPRGRVAPVSGTVGSVPPANVRRLSAKPIARPAPASRWLCSGTVLPAPGVSTHVRAASNMHRTAALVRLGRADATLLLLSGVSLHGWPRRSSSRISPGAAPGISRCTGTKAAAASVNGLATTARCIAAATLSTTDAVLGPAASAARGNVAATGCAALSSCVVGNGLALANAAICAPD